MEGVGTARSCDSSRRLACEAARCRICIAIFDLNFPAELVISFGSIACFFSRHRSPLGSFVHPLQKFPAGQFPRRRPASAVPFASVIVMRSSV